MRKEGREKGREGEKEGRKEGRRGDFLGGPVVKTVLLMHRAQIQSWFRNKDPTCPTIWPTV